MKRIIPLACFLLLFSTTLLFSQKAEKVKGSKVVTTAFKDVQSFNTIELEDNVEIYLEKGEKNEIKIEADNNLHDIISLKVQDEILLISTTKEAVGYKKLAVKITYTNDLNLITAKDESVVNAIQEIILETITFKSLDKSKLFLNVNAKNFILQADDKSKTELNLKCETAFIELSKNASLTALLNCVELKCDLYQKATAVVEGDSNDSFVRIASAAELNARNLSSKNTEVIIEGKGSCSLLVENSCTIDATDNAEINLYGSPRIEIRKFSGEAKLFKKLGSKK